MPTTTKSPDPIPPIDVKISFRRQAAYLHVGMVVNWWYTGKREGQPYAAVVTKFDVINGAVNLSIMADQQMRFHKCEEGCRHIDDPAHNEHQKREGGAWEMTPTTRLLIDMALKNGYGKQHG